MWEGCRNTLPRPFIWGFSQPHSQLLNHTGALRMCAYWSTSHVEDNTEKPLYDVAPHLHGVVFLSDFPSQVCRGVEAFLWDLYSDIMSFALEMSYLGRQYETPPIQTWEWYRKDHKGWQMAQWLSAHVAHSEDPSLVSIRPSNCLQSCPRGPVRPSFGLYRYLHSSSHTLTHSHTNTTHTHKHYVYILKFAGNNKRSAFLISLGAGLVLTLPVGPCWVW